MPTPQPPAFAHPAWRKSSHSTGVNECIEVAGIGAAYAVRDSKNPGGGHLTIDQATWKAFLTDIKAGRHDPDRTGG